ncbi:MAG: hypothetical protein NFCOHLIN_01028 [Gammaproteobacteria bacterium]|nr:hypothetical protein [Gammaproteobacteria bacterium]
MVEHLGDGIDRNLVRVYLDEARIVHVFIRELLHAQRQGRREQHRQPPLRGRHAPEQEPDVLDEAQIEHAIRLVQHHHLDGAQVEDMLLEIVNDASGRADQNFHTRLQLGALLVVVHAAIDQRHLQARELPEHLRILVDLDGELARGGQHDGAGLIGFALLEGGFLHQALHQRQQECRGLARAGLRLAGDILAGQRQGQRPGLDRCAADEPRRLHALQQLGMQPQSVEYGVFAGLGLGHGR